MRYFRIPHHIDKALELEEDEECYIIKESDNPTKIIYTRGETNGKEIIHIGLVENTKTKVKNSGSLFGDYVAIVKAPQKLVPNQVKMQKTLIIGEGQFMIILK